MQKREKKRLGFTIIEILIVVSIIAVIATLGTGAAIRSVKQSRSRRIQATRQMLELGLNNYRALHGEWPESFGVLSTDGKYRETTGVGNARIFEKVFRDVKSNRSLIDTSVIFTRTGQGRMTVKQALERGISEIPVGYPDPENPDKFCYFKVRYNCMTDHVEVHLEKD